MKHALIFATALAVGVAAGTGVAAAQSPQTNAAAALTPEPLGTECTYNFGGGTLAWCVSSTGSLMRFTSPAGFEHIRIGGFQEGYAVCAPSGNYYDIGLVASRWGPPILVSLGTATVSIRRFTTDGYFELLQKWTRDKNERDVTVTMTLWNRGPGAANVKLMRNADLDVDNTFDGDRWDQSLQGGWVRQGHAVTMSNLTLGVAHQVVIDSPSHVHSDCAPPPVASPGGPGDPGVSIIYDFGAMSRGAKKVVKVVYRAQ
jgi:hypothetical protein